MTSTLFAGAKAHLLANGAYTPTLWATYRDAKGQEHLGLYLFDRAATALEEAKQYFAHGADFGREQGRVEFSSLAWISQVGDAAHGFHDYLVAMTATFSPGLANRVSEQCIERAEIVRPAPGVIDLLEEPARREQGTIHLTLPLYWLAGYLFETRLSEQERAYVASMIEKGK